MQKIISVTSGKGGVGKTLTTINFALAARSNGHSVLVIDGDFGLANVDVLLGLTPSKTFADVLDGTCTIRDIIQKGPRGIDLISSGSGISRLANLGNLERSCILAELSRLPQTYDVVIIDTSAGISSSVLSLNAASHHYVVVTTPEPHALTDAYALIKVMAEDHDRIQCSLLINQVRSDDEGTRIGLRLAEVAKQYCGVTVTPVGHIRSDSVLNRSILARKVAWDGALHTLAGQGWSSAWRRIWDLTNSPQEREWKRPIEQVWSVLAGQTTLASNL